MTSAAALDVNESENDAFLPTLGKLRPGSKNLLW